MDFNQKKLSKEDAEKLRRFPISEIEPYALIFSPAYVFMRLNEKFVSVKGPLDFFNPEELARLAPFESFFFLDVVDVVSVFREAARSVRGLLSWKAKAEGELPPASFEISRAILQKIAPLWSLLPEGGIKIEPFFVAAFAEELCGSLNSEKMILFREADVKNFERAVLLSGWMVFLALHLGIGDLDHVREIRRKCFEGSLEKQEGIWGTLEAELLKTADGTLTTTVRSESFVERSERASSMLASRLKRVESMIPPPQSENSADQEGLAHVS